MRKLLTVVQIITALVLVGFCVYLNIDKNFNHVVTKNQVKLLASSYGVVNITYKDYEEVLEKVEQAEEGEVSASNKDDKDEFDHLDKHLTKYNSDYIGAINIPDIGTSDAVYKSEGDYYLDKDYNKNDNELGEVYLDQRTGESIIGNGALLNGHAVKNGEKFGNFKKLLDLEEAPKIYVYDHQINKTHVYKIMFMSLIDGSNSGIIMDFETEEQRLKYYNRMYDTAIKKWDRPKEGSKFLLLNSCSYIIKDGRYVVFAQKEE